MPQQSGSTLRTSRSPLAGAALPNSPALMQGNMMKANPGAHQGITQMAVSGFLPTPPSLCGAGNFCWGSGNTFFLSAPIPFTLPQFPS